jgi:8-oxo-dGTP pyrophosphatase MutT (NUDIX family)
VIRELAEETGLVVTDPGRPVWWQQHVFAMTRWDGQHDTFFYLEVDHFDPRPTLGFEQLRAEHVDAIEWWSLDDVQKAQSAYDAGARDDPAYTTFSPRQLGHHLAALLADGPPVIPMDVSSRARSRWP